MNSKTNTITKNNFKKIAQIIGLGLLFMVIAAILIRMPIQSIGQKMANHIDCYLISWIWSWDIHALSTNPLQLFQANIFTPFTNTLAFSETMLGTALIAWPILILSNDNMNLTYNIVILLTFAISGIGMYLLMLYLTKNKLAALISALIYSFAPFKLIHSVGHLHLTGMWLPFVYLYLHKFIRKQTWKNLIILFTFTILTFLTGFHYFIYLPIVFLVFISSAWLLKKIKLSKKNIIKLIIFIITLVILISPIIIPYLKAKTEYNQIRTIELIEACSPDLIDYLIPPILYHKLYSCRANNEINVSFGIIVTTLLILSIIYLLKTETKKLNRHLKLNAFIYATTGLIAFMISFGFYIQLTSNDNIGILGIYNLFYHLIPGFSGIRATGRYSIFLLISICFFIGYAINIWDKNNKNIFKKIITIFIIITLMLIEFSSVPAVTFSYNLTSKPQFKLNQWMKNQPDDNIFIELPIGVDMDSTINYDIFNVYNSRYHFKKIINGYSGYYPPGYLNLVKKLKTFEPENDLNLIKKFKADYIIFHFDKYTEDNKNYTINQANCSQELQFIKNFDYIYIYKINDYQKSN